MARQTRSFDKQDCGLSMIKMTSMLKQQALAFPIDKGGKNILHKSGTVLMIGPDERAR